MIEQALQTILNKLNEPDLVLSSPLPERPTVTVVYLEPPQILKNLQPGHRVRKDVQNAVYFLVSGSTADYIQALSFLERVAKFFYDNPVWEQGFQIEQYAPGIDQQCGIWTALQVPYRPSLMYKLQFANRNI